MATAKVRSTKRPSATSSYSSATTIVIFVGLSVLGLWLLTSNSFSPPQPTPTILTRIPSTADDNNSNPDPLHVQRSTEDNKPDEATVIDDLETKPEKAEATDQQESMGEPEKQEAMETQTSEESSMTHKQVVEMIKEEKQQSEMNAVADVTDQRKEENPLSETNVVADERDRRKEEDVFPETNAVANETDQRKEENPQSERNVVANEMDQRKEENLLPETNVVANETDHGSEATENQITDADQQKRVEEHQQRGDEQNQQEQEAKSKDPVGATSHDQIQHDEVEHVDSHQEKKIQETEHQEETNQETEHEPPVENGDSLSSIPKESSESKKSWSTQAHQSEDQKERRKAGSNDKENSNHGHTWLLCNVTAGADYIPCLDNEKAIAKIHKRLHHEHRERHCPEDPPTCLVPLPHGYKRRIEWPQSRDKIWYSNVPHTSLAEFKGHQNWVKVTGEFLTFPGGGTQFIRGALHYIEFLQEAVPEILWGKHSRVVLDVGCGVASFGGYLFEKDVITMSFAPKDEHEAQVQFALERGIPAISAVMGSQRLPFPSRVFDVVHCARCRVPWHADGGALLLELNRVLRPGGYFVWSATPVYQKREEDVKIWKEMSRLTVAMCWELVTIKKDKKNSIGAAIYQKPDTNDCYERRKQNEPPLCKTDDDPNAAWYVPLQSCMHRIPTQENERGSQWPEEWPERLQAPPYWLNKTQMGIYGKPAPDDFASDYKHWKKVVSTMYMKDMGINWSEVRNVMDLRAVYGGFAAALKDQNLWVMNVVNVDSPDTLPIIYERGLLGIYHDWCESFSTYPRSYDLLHADHLFSKLKKRCSLEVSMAEIDRILRPGGKLIVRDEASTVAEVLELLKSLHWEVFLNHSKNQEGILSAQKSDWRPTGFADSS